MKSPMPLPVGWQNFNFLRKRGRVYVDKTTLVAKIAQIEATPIFLSRPRRFGKSLLLSTFHSLFSCGTKYFAGLNIEKKWSDSTYHIVEIDFSTFSETGNGTFNFSERFCNRLKEFFKPILGSIPEIHDDPQLLLERMLLKCEDFSIVLLIDAYDAPLT